MNLVEIKTTPTLSDAAVQARREFKQLDTAQNGQDSLKEFAGDMVTFSKDFQFKRDDKNRDGKLSQGESFIARVMHPSKPATPEEKPSFWELFKSDPVGGVAVLPYLGFKFIKDKFFS